MLRPGDVIARSIRNKNGQTVLKEGTPLTGHYLDRLEQMGIKTVMIESLPTASVLAPIGSSQAESSQKGRQVSSQANQGMMVVQMHQATPQLRRKNDHVQQEYMLHYRERVKDTLIRVIEPGKLLGRMTDEALESRFRRVFRSIMLDISSHSQMVDYLAQLLEMDNYLFEHSINVAELSCIMGVAGGFDSSELLELTIGGLMFDIGMIKQPPSLLKSDRKLTYDERMTLQNHTTEGYRMLLEIDGVSHKAAQCALFHHERFNGNGYPMRVKGMEIPEMAQIVAIADVFDALISPRHHRSPFSESEAIEYLFASGNHFFRADLVNMFLKQVLFFPEASVLKLSSGQVAVVTATSTGMAHRPIVKIIRESDGTAVGSPYELDLALNRDIVVLHSIQGIG
ncbi:HD domain-containing protein [Paenibacillaceae bacterium]|nr:HD domain-containing protein [Paenibacillaceae bacterium]